MINALKLISVLAKVLALLIGYFLCVSLRRELLPLGFATPLDAEGVFRYVSVSFAALLIFAGMMIVAESCVRWIHGENISDLVKRLKG